MLSLLLIFFLVFLFFLSLFALSGFLDISFILNPICKSLGLQGNGETTEKYIGQTAKIRDSFEAKEDSYKGLVNFQGAIWKARSSDQSILDFEKGEEVKIAGVDGLTLIVLPLSK